MPQSWWDAMPSLAGSKVQLRGNQSDFINCLWYPRGNQSCGQFRGAHYDILQIKVKTRRTVHQNCGAFASFFFCSGDVFVRGFFFPPLTHRYERVVIQFLSSSGNQFDKRGCRVDLLGKYLPLLREWYIFHLGLVSIQQKKKKRTLKS